MGECFRSAYALVEGGMVPDWPFKCHCRQRNSMSRQAPRFQNTCTGLSLPAKTFHDCTVRFTANGALSELNSPDGPASWREKPS
jgi:hypothetical protein